MGGAVLASLYPRCPRPLLGGRPPRSAFDSQMTMGVGGAEGKRVAKKEAAIEGKTVNVIGVPC